MNPICSLERDFSAVHLGPVGHEMLVQKQIVDDDLLVQPRYRDNFLNQIPEETIYRFGLLFDSQRHIGKNSQSLRNLLSSIFNALKHIEMTEVVLVGSSVHNILGYNYLSTAMLRLVGDLSLLPQSVIHKLYSSLQRPPEIMKFRFFIPDSVTNNQLIEVVEKHFSDGAVSLLWAENAQTNGIGFEIVTMLFTGTEQRLRFEFITNTQMPFQVYCEAVELHLPQQLFTTSHEVPPSLFDYGYGAQWLIDTWFSIVRPIEGVDASSNVVHKFTQKGYQVVCARPQSPPSMLSCAELEAKMVAFCINDKIESNRLLTKEDLLRREATTTVQQMKQWLDEIEDKEALLLDLLFIHGRWIQLVVDSGIYSEAIDNAVLDAYVRLQDKKFLEFSKEVIKRSKKELTDTTLNRAKLLSGEKEYLIDVCKHRPDLCLDSYKTLVLVTEHTSIERIPDQFFSFWHTFLQARELDHALYNKILDIAVCFLQKKRVGKLFDCIVLCLKKVDRIAQFRSLFLDTEIGDDDLVKKAYELTTAITETEVVHIRKAISFFKNKEDPSTLFHVLWLLQKTGPYLHELIWAFDKLYHLRIFSDDVVSWYLNAVYSQKPSCLLDEQVRNFCAICKNHPQVIVTRAPVHYFLQLVQQFVQQKGFRALKQYVTQSHIQAFPHIFYQFSTDPQVKLSCIKELSEKARLLLQVDNKEEGKKVLQQLKKSGPYTYFFELLEKYDPQNGDLFLEVFSILHEKCLWSEIEKGVFVFLHVQKEMNNEMQKKIVSLIFAHPAWIAGDRILELVKQYREIFMLLRDNKPLEKLLELVLQKLDKDISADLEVVFDLAIFIHAKSELLWKLMPFARASFAKKVLFCISRLEVPQKLDKALCKDLFSIAKTVDERKALYQFIEKLQKNGHNTFLQETLSDFPDCKVLEQFLPSAHHPGSVKAIKTLFSIASQDAQLEYFASIFKVDQRIFQNCSIYQLLLAKESANPTEAVVELVKQYSVLCNTLRECQDKATVRKQLLLDLWLSVMLPINQATSFTGKPTVRLSRQLKLFFAQFAQFGLDFLSIFFFKLIYHLYYRDMNENRSEYILAKDFPEVTCTTVQTKRSYQYRASPETLSHSTQIISLNTYKKDDGLFLQLVDELFSACFLQVRLMKSVKEKAPLLDFAAQLVRNVHEQYPKNDKLVEHTKILIRQVPESDKEFFAAHLEIVNAICCINKPDDAATNAILQTLVDLENKAESIDRKELFEAQKALFDYQELVRVGDYGACYLASESLFNVWCQRPDLVSQEMIKHIFSFIWPNVHAAGALSNHDLCTQHVDSFFKTFCVMFTRLLDQAKTNNGLISNIQNILESLIFLLSQGKKSGFYESRKELYESHVRIVSNFYTLPNFSIQSIYQIISMMNHLLLLDIYEDDFRSGRVQLFTDWFEKRVGACKTTEEKARFSEMTTEELLNSLMIEHVPEDKKGALVKLAVLVNLEKNEEKKRNHILRFIHAMKKLSYFSKLRVQDFPKNFQTILSKNI